MVGGDKIIIDTREQKPLWTPDKFNVEIRKLDEGDYTTLELLGKAHIERKSPADLYGSIIQGHERFRKELIRANDKGLKLAVFVECPEEVFYKKRFPMGRQLKTPGRVLKKIINTIKIKYGIEFIWCEDREDMMDKMCLWFVDRKFELDEDSKGNTSEISVG